MATHKTFVYGRGYRKSIQQRHYEKLQEYIKKLEEYIEKVKICSPNCNSYLKSDHLATFMRIKTDYMGNEQLLPAYNVLPTEKMSEEINTDGRKKSIPAKTAGDALMQSSVKRRKP